MQGRPVATNRLVGRDAELTRLRKLVASGDGVRVGLVGGEAGIGKTRIVDEALADVGETSIVIRLRGDATRSCRPFGVLVGGLEPYVRDWTEVPAALAGRREAVAALLEPVAPALSGVDRDHTDREVGPDTLERAAADVLRYLAPDLGALVIVADDLHWTDAESVMVLQQLVMGVAGLDDVVVLGTYRPDGLLARSPVTALLAAAERRQEAVNLRLDRLELDDVADYASSVFGSDVPYRAVKALHHRSGGNPFFLGELVAVAGDAGVDAIADLPLPWTIAEAFRDILDGLSDGEREVAETAAVLGHRIPFDLLARVTGLDERELIGRLRAVVAAGLLVEDEVDVFAFRHALVRESIAGGLLGRERRRLHEAALLALLDAPDSDDAAVAHHAEGAGRIDIMLDAVRRAAVSALRRGAPYHALEFAETGLAEAPEDGVLGEVATRAAWLVGALGDATQHAVRWIRAAEARGDVVEESRARRILVRVTADSGDDVAHRREFERLRALVDRLPPGEHRAAVLADLAQASMLARRIRECLEFVDLAVAEADLAGAEQVKVQALVERWSCGPPDGGTREDQVAHMLDAVAQAEGLGDHLTAARGLNNVIDLVPVHERRRVIERMKENAERVGFAALSAYSYAENLAELATMAADRTELERWLADAWRWCRVGQCHRSTRWLRFYDALLVTEATDPAQVVEHSFALRTGAGHDAGADMLIGLLWAARTGDAEAAEVAARAWVETPRLSCDNRNMAVMADGLLRAGVSLDRVDALVRSAVDAGATPSPITEALLAARRGESDVAAAHLAEVGDEVEAWLRAEVHVLVAEALLDTDPAAAATHADEAMALLAIWPGWRRDRAEALRRRLERRTARAGSHDLSAREVEVAALLAEGLTNAQIAERLFIARKTVAVHVSNILAKLGMRSRTEVAAWAVREGVGVPPTLRAG